MPKKLISVLVSLLLLLAPVTACGTTPTENIKIGAVMDLSGALAGIGGQLRDSIVLAVKQVNDAGGINGAQVELIVEDGKTDPTAGFEAVKKLVEVNGINVIIGPMISGASLASGPYALQNEVLLFSPSATSPDIADQDWRQFFLRTAPTDILQGKAIAQLVMEGGYQKVAILVMDNQYGVGVAHAVAEELSEKAEVVSRSAVSLMGKHLIVANLKYDPSKLDYRTELQVIKDNNPDAVIHVGYHDDAQIVYKQALQLGLDDIQWVTAEGTYAEAVLEVTEAAQFMAAAVIGTRLSAPEGLAAFEEYATAYEVEFGKPPGVYCDTVYDATKMVLKAIEGVGADDTAKIAAKVLKIADNYPGTSGSITLSANGDRVSGDFEVWKVIKDGDTYRFERVKVISL